MSRLDSASTQVAQLKERLAQEKVELEEKEAFARELVNELALDTKKVEEERAVAEEEEHKLGAIAEEVAAKQAVCDEELKKAEPALERARLALETFEKDDLVFMKALPAPTKGIRDVMKVVMILFAEEGRIPRNLNWAAARKFMGEVNSFYNRLLGFDNQNIPEDNIRAVQQYVNDPKLAPDRVFKQSKVCAWWWFSATADVMHDVCDLRI